MCLSAVAASTALLRLRRQRSQRASRILSHLALLPGAGRLHVGCGWRHPRPVATDDAAFVAYAAPTGDKFYPSDGRSSAINVTAATRTLDPLCASSTCRPTCARAAHAQAAVRPAADPWTWTPATLPRRRSLSRRRLRLP